MLILPILVMLVKEEHFSTLHPFFITPFWNHSFENTNGAVALESSSHLWDYGWKSVFHWWDLYLWGWGFIITSQPYNYQLMEYTQKERNDSRKVWGIKIIETDLNKNDPQTLLYNSVMSQCKDTNQEKTEKHKV